LLEENSGFRKFDRMVIIGLIVVGAVSAMGATYLFSANMLNNNGLPPVRITNLINHEVLATGPLEIRGTVADVSALRAISVRVDGDAPLSVTPNSPNDFSEWSARLDMTALGSHTIEVEALDNLGKTTTTEISVMVRDTASVLALPTHQIIEASGPSGAFVSYPLPTVHENIRSPGEPECTPAPGSMFPVGTTTVTCAVSYAGGNRLTAEFTISVLDTTPPTITAPSDVTVISSGSELTKFSLGNPVVRDLVDENPVVSNDASSDGFPLGTSIVVWIASDEYGNKAMATQKVTVTGTVSHGGSGGSGGGSGGSGESDPPATTDTTAPTVTASPRGGDYSIAQSVTLTSSEPATIYYTRDGSTPTTSSSIYNSPLSISSTTTLKYIARDKAGNNGNVVTQVYTINTIDATLPSVTISQPAGNSVTASDGKILVTGTASDSGSGIKVVEVRVDDGAYATATPKASGDWSSWKITLSITSGEHRLVPRATDNVGNQAWNSKNIIVTIPKEDNSLDEFGIEKIYPTKTGGNEWYVNMEDPRSDGLFRNLPSMTKQSDGSWQVSASQVRMEAWSPSNEKWLDIEITGYAKMISGSNELIQWYSRGGHHTNSDQCLGSAYKGRLYGDGHTTFVKEVTHPAYTSNRGSVQAADASLVDRWIGFKAVMYNFVENGKTYVRMESYIDNDVTDSNGNLVIGNNWQLASVVEDRGGWSTTNSDFNASCFPVNKDSTQQYRQRDEILNLPGGTSTQNIAGFRSDDLTWNWKYLSVREIVP
jgi:hypothetical protein